MVDCTPKGKGCQGYDLHNLYLVSEGWLVYTDAMHTNAIESLFRLEIMIDFAGEAVDE
jgi:hypothetical protein